MPIDPQLLGAVLADPDADEPREITADWLDEHGDHARATLIRAQLAAARLPEHERAAVRARRKAEALLLTHGARWRAELPELEDLEWGDFDRGFVGTVRARTVGALFRHAPVIWDHQPVHAVEMQPRASAPGDWVPRELPRIRRVRLVSLDDNHGWFDLAPTEQQALRTLLRPVEVLEVVVRYAEDDAYLEVVQGLEAPALRELRMIGQHTAATAYARIVAGADHPLRVLDLGTDFVDYDSGYFEDPTLGEAGARMLAEAPGLDGLEHLGLDLQRLGADGVQRLLERFEGLTTLSLRRMDLPALPALPGGPPIAHLRLGGNDLGPAPDVLDQPRLAGLLTLDLSENEIDHDGVQRVIEAPCWSTLRQLDLSRNPLRGAGPVLAKAPAPEHLHTLLLADADLQPDDVADLLTRPWVGQLDRLDLGSNVIVHAAAGLAEAGIRVLGLASAQLDSDHVSRAHGGLARCERLDLSDNNCAGALPGLLADAPELVSLSLRKVPLGGWDPSDGAGAPLLTSLDLALTGLGDEGLRALLTGPLGRQLVDLDLTTCGLGSDAIDALVAWPRLRQLNRLILRGNNALVGDELIRLAEAFDRPIPVMRVPENRWRLSPETNALFDERFGPHWDQYEGT